MSWIAPRDGGYHPKPSEKDIPSGPPPKGRGASSNPRKSIEELIEASSLGTPAAKAARASVSQADVDRALAIAGIKPVRDTPHLDGIQDTGEGYTVTQGWHIRCLWCSWWATRPTKREAETDYRDHEHAQMGAESQEQPAECRWCHHPIHGTTFCPRDCPCPRSLLPVPAPDPELAATVDDLEQPAEYCDRGPCHLPTGHRGPCNPGRDHNPENDEPAEGAEGKRP